MSGEQNHYRFNLYLLNPYRYCHWVAESCIFPGSVLVPGATTMTLYVNLAELLGTHIEQGFYRPGDRLPSVPVR